MGLPLPLSGETGRNGWQLDWKNCGSTLDNFFLW